MSDQISTTTQYVSIRYTERRVEGGVLPSVGSVGDSYNNALAETINGLYKTEVIHRRGPWRSFETVELATLEWAQPPRGHRPRSGKGWVAEGDWFNTRRPFEPISNSPPAEAEAPYYAQLREAAIAA